MNESLFTVFYVGENSMFLAIYILRYIGDNCETFTFDVMTMLMPYFLFPKEYRYMH